MYKYIISYDGGQLRDSSDFEWGQFGSYGEAEEAANVAKEEYIMIGILKVANMILMISVLRLKKFDYISTYRKRYEWLQTTVCSR